MDVFKDIFATQAFEQCSKILVNYKGGDKAEQFEQCGNNYINAYKVIGKEFVHFFTQLPSKDRYGPPEQDE